MPIASGRYWNNGFGRGKGEVEGDAEGIQNARFVARNMLFLMKSIALGKEKFGLPETEETVRTGEKRKMREKGSVLKALLLLCYNNKGARMAHGQT